MRGVWAVSISKKMIFFPVKNFFLKLTNKSLARRGATEGLLLELFTAPFRAVNQNNSL